MESDETLIKQCLNGDQAAYDFLVERYQHKIYNLTYRYTGNPTDAADLTQETFLKAYLALSGFRRESSFSTWLYHIAVNICRDEYRKKKRKKNLSLEELQEQGSNPEIFISEQGNPEESILSSDTQRLVQNCLNQLSEEHRLILILREIKGLPYEEISQCLGCSLGTIKSRLNRARKALKQKIENNPELSDILNRHEC